MLDTAPFERDRCFIRGMRTVGDAMTPEERRHLVRFIHPHKVLAIAEVPCAGSLDEKSLASLFGLSHEAYRQITSGLCDEVIEIATEMLADPEFASAVDRLPFMRTDTIVAVGDSITDDQQSWAELLRALLARRFSTNAPTVVNAGISGDTTTDVVRRFHGIVRMRPDWFITMIGTNDAGRHGGQRSQVLVSDAETGRNLNAIRASATTRTRARLAWITPPPVHDDLFAEQLRRNPQQVVTLSADVLDKARLVLGQPDPVIDVFALLGDPVRESAYFLSDGVHLSLHGQRLVVAELVRVLTRAR